MKKILIICLSFSSLFSSADQWWGEKETNSLMVAYQLLDDQWIQDVGALTSDWARVYYSSLNESQPPTYGVYVPNANGTSITYAAMSQKDLWDYMYNTAASNGNNLFRSAILNDNDGLGDYITIGRLLPSGGWGTQNFDNNGNVVQTVNDVGLMSVSHRLATLNTMQTTRELQIMSNAVCNCDWEIVSNIYTVVNSALYSSWQGQNWSVADWTRFIWNYLTTNNSGKPIKESLNDISSYLSSTSDNISNIWSWIQEHQGSFTNSIDYSILTNNLWKFDISGITNSTFKLWGSGDTAYFDNGAGTLFEYIYGNPLYTSTIFDGTFGGPYDVFLAPIYGSDHFNNAILNSILWGNLLTWAGSKYTYDYYLDFSNLRDSLTNKTTSVAYTLVEPSVGRDIYGTLTNAYITSGSMNSSDWNWFDRVEMLLAALVFPETTSSNGVADADSAQSSAESQSDQFKDVLTSIQSTAFGSAKQQTQTTANTFTGFFTTLNSALTLNPPEALIIPVPNTPTDLEDSSGDLSWTVDFSSGSAKVTLEFCRALSSFIVIVGFLFVVWKIGLLTFHVTLTISSLCFKTVQRILGK